MRKVSTFLFLALNVIVVFVAITLVPGIPPMLQFDAYNVKPQMLPKGPTHKTLHGVEKLFEGEILVPEHMEVHKGVLYTSTATGYVVKIIDDKIIPVVRFGRDCDMLQEPEICGRPLGLSFDSKGFMYVADAAYGIFKVNVTTGEYEQLVSMDTKINNKKPGLPNSVVVASDGSVYWTDSSTTHGMKDVAYICLSNGSGRLIKYNPVTKSNTVLIDNIMANGVALSNDEAFIIVVEMMKARILRYNLKGPKRGESEVFLDALPGYPDNVHALSNGEFQVTLAIMSTVDQPGLFQLLAPYPLIRKFLTATFYLIEVPALFINQYFPNYYTKLYTNWVGSPAMLSLFDYTGGTTIVFFNHEGKITRSLHSSDKSCSSTSDVALLDGNYYLGSYANSYIVRAKAR